jgi:hypothetical protein
MYLAFGSPVRIVLLTVFFVLFSHLFIFVSVFYGETFNGDISSWDVSSVTSMETSKWKAALPS